MRRFVALALSSALAFQTAPLLAATGGADIAAQVAVGVLRGTAQTTTGATAPNSGLQLRNLQTGQVVGKTASDSAGAFSFSGLAPASYVVEIVDVGGKVVGTSAPVSVAAGSTATVAVASTAAAAIAPAAGAAAAAVAGGSIFSTALVVTTVAAAAGIAGVVVVRNNASASR